MSRYQNAGQSHNIKTDNSSFERVEEFKYLGTNFTHQNSIRLRVFENRVLKTIFVPKRDEVTGEWKKLPDIVWVIKLRMGLVGHVAHMGEGSGVYRVLVGKPEGKRPLERLRYRWEDNIKMDCQEGGCGGKY